MSEVLCSPLAVQLGGTHELSPQSHLLMKVSEAVAEQNISPWEAAPLPSIPGTEGGLRFITAMPGVVHPPGSSELWLPVSCPTHS